MTWINNENLELQIWADDKSEDCSMPEECCGGGH
jgi:hypothetical protein